MSLNAYTRNLTAMLFALTLGLGLLVPRIALANVERYVVGINGMACPFCAYGLEKKLSGIAGVKSVDVHLKRGTADVEIASGATVTPRQLDNAVRNAGFEVRNLSLTGNGTLTKRDGRSWLKLTPGLTFEVERHQGKEGRFHVLGRLHRDGDHWVLVIDSERAE